MDDDDDENLPGTDLAFPFYYERKCRTMTKALRLVWDCAERMV